jgi:serine/threonine protein kinase
MTPPIVHRDLKPANILIDHRSGDVVLGDFGRSLRLGEHDQCASLIDGTREYMAAELLEGRITTNADVYAFGMTLLHILTQERPYSECGSLEEIEERVVAGTLPEALDRLPSGAFRDTILDCLQPLETRPSSSDLLQRFRSLSSTQTVSELDH